jgi:hypothetical protein
VAAAITLGFAFPAGAQISNYLGPGILTRGAGNVGTRGGQQVDLRIGGSVSGIYDTGIVPLIVDETGSLVRLGGQYGVEASLFAYGTHSWRRSQLGLDYLGNYRHYPGLRYFNSSDHMLVLGYTHQKSQRLVFDFRQVAGTISRGNSGFGGFAAALPSDVFDPNTAFLFDNRAYFLQSGMDVSYLTSARTILRAGGQGFLVRRQSRALVGVNGYNLDGSIQHRLSQATTIGAQYMRVHFDFPNAFGESDINVYAGLWSRALGRRWTLAVQGGVYQVEAQGLQRIALEPAVAAILGVREGIQAFYRRNTFPTGNIRLARQFRSATFSMMYSRGFNPGNGVFLTSRMESGGVNLSYFGIRRWGLSVFGGYNTNISVGQINGTFRQANGGVGITYAITPAVQLITRYDARHQDLTITNFNRVSYRVTVGFGFSPGNIPLTLW